MNYLWDTNTAIYYLQQQFTPEAEKRIEDLLALSIPYISAITEIELLSWNTSNDADLLLIHEFIKSTPVIEIEQEIKLKTAEIRKQKKLKLPDAIIAATALVYELTLVTRNTRDFENVSGLKLINPW